MSVKQRLADYIKSKKISKSEFCRVIGVSNAYISSIVTSIQPDKLQSITLKYSDLNIGWLLTGVGEMLLYSTHNESTDPHNLIRDNSSNFMNDNISGDGNSVNYDPATPSLPTVRTIKKNKGIEFDKTNNSLLAEIELLKQLISERDNIIAQKDIIIEGKDVLIAEKERLISVLMK